MSKVSHTIESLDDFAKTMTALAARATALRKSLVTNRIDAVKIDFEQRRARGVGDLVKWLEEAETEVEIILLRKRRGEGNGK